jgi:hypothetical protein
MSIIDLVGYSDQTFRLVQRQELSRTAGGTTYGKDLGPALWFADYTTAPLPTDAALDFEARLNALNGVIGTFDTYDLRRPYPRAHSDGDFVDSGKINSVNGAKISLKDLPPGLHLSVGDYVSLEVQGRRVLHQLVEAATANGSGVTPEFKVQPAPWPGTIADVAVILKKPSCRMALLPQSITTRTAGMYTTISFKAGQV